MSNDLADIIQIDDPQIDTAELTRRVARNLRTHGFDENIQFPEFDVVPAQYKDGTRFPTALYYDLEQATLAFGQTWVELQSITSRIPLLTPLKRMFHQLAVYYVNLFAERQMAVNGALLRVLNHFVRTLEHSDGDEIVALRREVDELRGRVERLEKAGGNRSDRGEET